MSGKVQDAEEMPRSFWQFNVGHLLTLLGGVAFAWMASLSLQAVITTMQQATAQNDRAIQAVASDLSTYRGEQARIIKDIADVLERVKDTTAKTQSDVSYLRGRSDRTDIGGAPLPNHP